MINGSKSRTGKILLKPGPHYFKYTSVNSDSSYSDEKSHQNKQHFLNRITLILDAPETKHKCWRKTQEYTYSRQKWSIL
jgi:hypothetical protein